MMSFAVSILLHLSAASMVFGPLPAPAPVEPDPFFAVGAPVLEITKSCPQLRYLGRDATFEIVVTNRGDGPANNVVVTDTVSNGVEFRNADNDGQREGNNVVWRLGTLNGGESRTLKMTVHCNTITTVKNSARVAYCSEAVAECEFPVKGIPAILLECVDDPDPIEVGSEVTYTITVTNQGTETGTNIAVVCTLPSEQEFVKGGGATQPTASGKTVTFAPLATLAPKAKASFLLTVKGVSVGDVRFGVSMKSDQIDTPVTETEATRIY